MNEHNESVEALAAFINAAAKVADVCIDGMTAAQAEALTAALAEGGRITLTFSLHGLPCVVGHLAQPGQPVREAFRLEARHRGHENSAVH